MSKSKSKFTVAKNEDMFEVKDELGTVLDVFESRIAAREFIKGLNTEKSTVTHMEGDYGDRTTTKTEKPIEVTPETIEMTNEAVLAVEAVTETTNVNDPIINTVDYRPFTKKVKVAVQELVGIATRTKERANSKAGKIRAYFDIAHKNNVTVDEAVTYLMENFGESKPRAKAYIKCFW